MSLSRYLENCRRIINNPGCPSLQGLIRHSLWHVVRRFAPLPLQIRLTDRSFLMHQRRDELNGCSALAWSQGQYDYHSMSFLRNLISNPNFCRTCLDIGANIGAYSLLLSEASTVHVHAFEPHPVTCKTLQNNLQANQRNNVTIWNVALSDANGKVAFSDAGNSPLNQILEHTDAMEPFTQVTAMRGDDWCNSHQVQPDIIKIDTEGHEASVLKGFGDLLRKTKIILIEENVSLNDTLLAIDTGVFHGPWYVDFPNKRLLTTKFNHEDAIYCNHNSLAELQSMSYQLPPSIVI